LGIEQHADPPVPGIVWVVLYEGVCCREPRNPYKPLLRQAISLHLPSSRRLGELAQGQRDLAAAQSLTEKRLEELAEAQKQAQ